MSNLLCCACGHLTLNESGVCDVCQAHKDRDRLESCNRCGLVVAPGHDCPAEWEQDPAIVRRDLASLRAAVEALAGEWEECRAYRTFGQGPTWREAAHRLRSLLLPGGDDARGSGWRCPACGCIGWSLRPGHFQACTEKFCAKSPKREPVPGGDDASREGG